MATNYIGLDLPFKAGDTVWYVRQLPLPRTYSLGQCPLCHLGEVTLRSLPPFPCPNEYCYVGAVVIPSMKSVSHEAGVDRITLTQTSGHTFAGTVTQLHCMVTLNSAILVEELEPGQVFLTENDAHVRAQCLTKEALQANIAKVLYPPKTIEILEGA